MFASRSSSPLARPSANSSAAHDTMPARCGGRASRRPWARPTSQLVFLSMPSARAPRSRRRCGRAWPSTPADRAARTSPRLEHAVDRRPTRWTRRGGCQLDRPARCRWRGAGSRLGCSAGPARRRSSSARRTALWYRASPWRRARPVEGVKSHSPRYLIAMLRCVSEAPEYIRLARSRGSRSPRAFSGR